MWSMDVNSVTITSSHAYKLIIVSSHLQTQQFSNLGILQIHKIVVKSSIQLTAHPTVD